MKHLLSGFALCWCMTVLAAEKPAPEMTVEAVLSEALPADAYVETTDCIRARGVKRVDVLDRGHLLIFGSHKRAWINRLETQCLGIRDDMIIMFDLWGTKICRYDFAYAQDRSKHSFDNYRDGGIIGGYASRCRLGPFEEVDHQQAEMVLEAFRKAQSELEDFSG